MNALTATVPIERDNSYITSMWRTQSAELEPKSSKPSLLSGIIQASKDMLARRDTEAAVGTTAEPVRGLLLSGSTDIAFYPYGARPDEILILQRYLGTIEATGTSLGIESVLAQKDGESKDSLKNIDLRKSFNRNLSNLAKLMGVSRPTIYTYLDAGVPLESQPRMERCLHLTKRFEAEAPNLFKHLSVMLNRPIYQGRNIVQVLEDKDSDLDAALDALINIFRQEDSRRQKIADVLRGKQVNATVDTFSTPFYGG